MSQWELGLMRIAPKGNSMKIRKVIRLLKQTS